MVTDVRAVARRASPALLVGGLALTAVMLSRGWPRETELRLRLEGDRAAVQRVECVVTPPGQTEEIGGAIWTAPRIPVLTTHVTAPPGDVEVRIRLESREGRVVETRRRVPVSGDPLTLPVPVDFAQ